VDRLRVFDPREELPSLGETARIACRELGGQIPLIGVAGAPFTLACYAVDGNPAGGCVATRAMMYGDPSTWHRLGEKLATVAASVLRAQIEQGAQAVQLFDSWVGALTPDDYRQFVLPHSRHVFEALADLGVPAIHFGTGTTDLLELMREAGGDVIGVDWRVPLDVAWARIGYDCGIQGNLDPALLLGPMEPLLAGAFDVLARAGGRAGHIFNLGHGLLPSTPVERVQVLTRYVHAHSAAA
jgi:uroporphyrinogen decarboxylase